MNDLWHILVQFIFRLSFGLSVSLVVTPASLVDAGFYRVHLWVLLGFNTLASLAVWSLPAVFTEVPVGQNWLLALCITATVASYVGSVIWLYQKRRSGQVALIGVALVSGTSAVIAADWTQATGGFAKVMTFVDPITAGLLLGATMAAMLLGHWYLNHPGMTLEPLKRLILLLAICLALRSAASAVGFIGNVMAGEELTTGLWIFFSLRWLAGLVGTSVMAVMAWYTLKVPNTQSATGILYAAVILVFIGELVSQLLSVDLVFPV